MAAPLQKQAPALFSRLPTAQLSGILPKESAAQSHGRSRFRKPAPAPFGIQLPVTPWHSGRISLIASLFQAWMWGRRFPVPADLRTPLYIAPQPRLVVFILDVSDSMTRTLETMQSWIAQSMQTAYFRRDYAAIIAVQGAEARLLVPPTTSFLFILFRLAAVQVGGGTPLDQGLLLLGRLLPQWHDRFPTVDLFLLTDGRSTTPLYGPKIEKSLGLIRKFVREVAVVNPLPAAEPFAQALASRLRALYFKPFMLRSVEAKNTRMAP